MLILNQFFDGFPMKVSIEETTSGPPGQTTHHVMSGRDPVFSTDMVANNIITFANSPPPAAVPTYDSFPRVSLKSALNFEDEESSRLSAEMSGRLQFSK